MRRIDLVLLLAISLFIFTACTAAVDQQPQEAAAGDEIVALVNGAPVKKAEYKQELDVTYRRFHEAGQIVDGSMYEQLKNEVRESLINLIVLDQYSRTLSIDVDNALVEKHYRNAVAKYPSMADFKKSLKASGLTESDLRMRLKRALAAQEVVRSHVEPGISVTDEEVREYYEQHPFEFEHDVRVHAAHILIQVHPLASDELKEKARQRILAILQKVKSGEDFATLAKTYSEGPSKVKGGDLGYFGTSQMAPAFETAAFSLEPGQVSDVVTTQYGYHLIKVYDRQPAGKEPFSEAGPRLKAMFHQERLNKALRELVEKLKSEAQIERFPLD